jgi:cytochrome P450
MSPVAELTLPALPVTDPAFEADPIPYIDAARAQHPWLARCDFGYFIHGYQAIKDIIMMESRIEPSHLPAVQHYQAEGTPWAKYMLEMLLNIGGEKHKRIRDSVGDAFTPRNVNRNMELIRTSIASLLDEWAPKGEFDFAEFASYFPIRVMCGLLGTTTEGIAEIREALETQSRVFSLDLQIRDRLLAGYDVLWNYCDRLIVERETSGVKGDLLLDQLIAAKNDGRMDETELRFLLMVLYPAGYDTSKNMLTLLMHQMLDHPDYWERCAADRDFCVKAVEEMFRYSSVISPFRTVTEDIDYDGVHFPKGTILIFGMALAARDPNFFERPNEFDPDRPHTNRHLGLGRGSHICLGQHLARGQLAEALHQIAQRMKKPRLAGGYSWRPFLGIWGLENLPIEFEPA